MESGYFGGSRTTKKFEPQSGKYYSPQDPSHNYWDPYGLEGLSWEEIFSLMANNARYATGGRIQGPGTGTSDSILAKLSAGEFVINAKATEKFLPLLKSRAAIVPAQLLNEAGIVGAAVVTEHEAWATQAAR